MYDQMVKASGRSGQITYWGKPLDWRNQTLTPNPDTLYVLDLYIRAIIGLINSQQVIDRDAGPS
jgi:hypothetical protein